MTSAPQNLHDALNVIRAMHNALLAFRHPDFNLVAPGREGEFDTRVKAVLALSAPLILADRDAAAMPVQLAVADTDTDDDDHRRNLELVAMQALAVNALAPEANPQALGEAMRQAIDALIGERQVVNSVQAVAAAEPLPVINPYAGLDIGDVVRTDDGVRWTIEGMGSAVGGVQCIRWLEPRSLYLREVFPPYALTVERKNHPEPLLPPGALVPGKPGSDDHASDCAVHNAPAEKPGPCDCQPAPRITAADVEATIASEHYFTAADGVAGEASLRHRMLVDGDTTPPDALRGVMVCVLVLKNGHVVTGDAFCADLSKPDPAVARVAARCRAFDKAFDMVVYGERERLAVRPVLTIPEMPPELIAKFKAEWEKTVAAAREGQYPA